MEKGWTYGMIYSVIQIHLVWGLVKATSDGKNVIYASPGTDVKLMCEVQKTSSLVQTQWSKLTNSTEMIALYHPQHGYHCNARTACTSLVTFTKISPNVSEWILHLRNVSAAANGKYECSFTLFPDGIWTKVLNLLIQTEVAQEERGGNYTAEVLFNHTLEIPCFRNISSVASSGITFAWLMEENGMQETRIIQNNTFPDNRIILRKDHALYLSPIEILDNNRKFSCHVTIHSGKILKNVTRITVFAKPEISMDMQNSSTDILEEKNFSCLVRNVFPTANLSWYIDGELLQDQKEGIDMTTEKRNRDEGFYELTSMLRVLKPNQSIVPNNLTVWCMTLFPVPGNEVWNISSRKITFSFGYVNTPTDSSNFTESTFSAFTSSLSSTGTAAGYTNTSTHPSNITASDVSVATPSLSSTDTTGYTNTSTHPSNITASDVSVATPSLSSTDTTADLWASTLTYNSTPSKASTTLNGTLPNKSEGGMSWPVIVASLLFICFFLFGLGVRKWCQYLKEIMERPPPFKPPPPPIKYTCIGEAVGDDLPCHEMETL
uniref:CD96 molecule n=1 Tax=Monodelphis domestica TaxID=13616 RepID=A0A5F8GRT4_MONDO